MSVLTLDDAGRRAISDALRDPGRVVVVSLCAAWCDTCAQFRAAFERIAAARSAMTFVWLDIEDDSDVCGDVDVENFPTLAVYRGGVPIHFGVSLPHEGTVARLVDALAARTEALADAPEAVSALPAALAAE
jgi:thioredoxin reductase (NADPH)